MTDWHTEVAVVGAGPAGLAAAAAAAKAGARVTLNDEYPQVGGQYFKQLPLGFCPKKPEHTSKENTRAQEFLRSLEDGHIEVFVDTVVWGVTEGKILAIYGSNGSGRLRTEKLILATGAYDRPIAFPGWAMPGVMTAGGVLTLVKNQRVLPGRRILLVGAGPFQLPLATQLLEGGARVVAVLEAANPREWWSQAASIWGHWGRLLEGWGYWRSLRSAGVPVRFAHTVLRAEGRKEVERAIITAVDEAWRPVPGTEESVEVDTICLGFGFLPSSELSRLCGCEHRYDPKGGGYIPCTDENMETNVPGIFAAGEATGIGGAEVAIEEGSIAGTAAAWQLGYLDESWAQRELAQARRRLRRLRQFSSLVNELFAIRPGLYELVTDDTVICRCEEVMAGEIRTAVTNGAIHVNELKAWTRAGMGLCQGRICWPLATQLMAREMGKGAEAVGAFTIRPPVKPVPLVSLLLEQGKESLQGKNHA
ncbi:MAG: FAD-dependent oxidoreductase, partial [candidate division NC10 bacterium]|nr:FAD-dependent oxidoreductase [candidate division NC10 bacterium]